MINFRKTARVAAFTTMALAGSAVAAHGKCTCKAGGKSYAKKFSGNVSTVKRNCKNKANRALSSKSGKKAKCVIKNGNGGVMGRFSFTVK